MPPRLYRNLCIDGTLDLPAHLRNVFIDFEQLYENLRYRRLENVRPRRRSMGGAVGEHGWPIYDTLARLVVEPSGEAAESSGAVRGRKTDGVLARRRSHSIDLAQAKHFAEIVQNFHGEPRPGVFREEGNCLT